MNEDEDVICHVRESFSGLRMDMPVETVFARSRARRRRRFSGLVAAAAATAGAVAAMTLAHSGPAPARSGNPPLASPGSVRPSSVRLAAFSVTSGPRGNTTLILRKGVQYRLDPSALRGDLARHGIPALVTVGTFCRSRPAAPAGLNQVVRPSTLADGSNVIVINGSALQPGTRLSIGYFPGRVRMAVVKDGAPLSCGSTSDQPAARITPSGTPIRAGQGKQ
jgi:hypothetical protein